METIDNERFKVLRRDSLHNEVDGFFDELEDFEDRSDNTKWSVTHQECLLLNRVLADKTKLPISCRASSTLEDVPVCTEKTAATPGDDGAIGGLVRRLTGAASEALSLVPLKRELGGVVTEKECRTLADYLTPSAGGLYVLPRACSRMLKAGKAAPSERYKENTDKNDLEKAATTVPAKDGCPPNT